MGRLNANSIKEFNLLKEQLTRIYEQLKTDFPARPENAEETEAQRMFGLFEVTYKHIKNLINRAESEESPDTLNELNAAIKANIENGSDASFFSLPIEEEHAKEDEFRRMILDNKMEAGDLIPAMTEWRRKRAEEIMYDRFGDDKYLKVWSASKKMQSLLKDAAMAAENNRLEDKKDALDGFIGKRSEYKAAYLSFTQAIPFGSYKELTDELEKQTKKQSELTDSAVYYERYNVKDTCEKKLVEIKTKHGEFLSKVNAEKQQLREELETVTRNIKEAKEEAEALKGEQLRRGNSIEQISSRMAENSRSIEAQNAEKAETVRLLADLEKVKSNSREKITAETAELTDYRKAGGFLARLKINGDEKRLRDTLIGDMDLSLELIQLADDLKIRLENLGCKNMKAEELNANTMAGYVVRQNRDKYSEEKDAKQLQWADLADLSDEFREKYKQIYKKHSNMPKEMEEAVDKKKGIEKIQAQILGTIKENQNFRLNVKTEPEQSEFIRQLADKIDVIESNTSAILETDRNKTDLQHRLADIDKSVADLAGENEDLEKDRTDGSVMDDINSRIIENARRIKNLSEKDLQLRGRAADLKLQSDKELETYKLDKEECDLTLNRISKEAGELDRTIKVVEGLTALNNKLTDFRARHTEFVDEVRKLDRVIEFDVQKGSVKPLDWTETKYAIGKGIAQFIADKNCGKKKDHTDSGHYTRMISSLEALDPGKTSDISRLSDDEMRERLEAVKRTAREYIETKLKNDWLHLTPTNMRKVRLNFAQRLEEYASDCLEKMDDMSRRNESFAESVKNANHRNVNFSTDMDSIIKMINSNPNLSRQPARSRSNSIEDPGKEAVRIG